jgi:pimeloyl-ACP methyl ester carboxylesterase
MSYAEPLARRMQQMADEFSEGGFDIVAHSIGGVMTREVLQRHPELADPVHQIVTLGSPHRGTAAVRWIKFGPIYAMLSLQSRYLKDLGDFQALAPGIEVTTVAALHDLIVYPSSVCHLEGTHPFDLEKISHLGLITESRVFVELEKALGDTRAQVG